MYQSRFFFTVLIFLLFSQAIISQNTDNNSAYYIAYDSIVGKENTNLYNGKRYIETYRSTKKNHLFFKDYTFLKGNILYNNQPYYDLKLKYDLLDDVVIVKLSGDKSFFNLKLISEQLQSFNIGDTHFVNLTYLNLPSNNMKLKGFAKLIYSGKNISLYHKLKKEKRERIKNQSIYYEFIDSNHFLVTFNNKLELINSKRNLKKLIPEMAKKIDAFYTNNKTLLKTNSELFMERLISSLDKNIENNTL